MRIRLFFSLFFVSVMLPFSVYGIDVSRQVSPNVVHIGDVVLFDILATYEAGVSLVAVPDADNFKGVEYRSKTVEKEKEGDIWRLRLRYELSFFDTGDQQVPSVDLVFKRNDTLLTFALPATPVRVDTLLSDDPYEKVALEGLLTPFSIHISWARYRRSIITAILLLGGLIAGAFYLFRWYKSRESVIDLPLDPRSAAQKALDELDELQGSHYVEKQHVKQYYLELTEIIKRYFSVLCHAPISEMTSEESYLVLSSVLKPEHMQTIRAFFELADLVKFAKFIPLSSVQVSSITTLRRLIEESMPAEAEARER
jgi:hypothetical protein